MLVVPRRAGRMLLAAQSSVRELAVPRNLLQSDRASPQRPRPTKNAFSLCGCSFFSSMNSTFFNRKGHKQLCLVLCRFAVHDTRSNVANHHLLTSPGCQNLTPAAVFSRSIFARRIAARLSRHCLFDTGDLKCVVKAIRDNCKIAPARSP